ncbi:MAG: O-antigen ligase family protein [Anaerolineae bacterium]
MNQPRRTWSLLCLVGLMASALLIGMVVGLRRHAIHQNTVQRHAALTGVAEWDGNWALSEEGADPSPPGPNRVTIPFTGSQLALEVRRGGYQAYLWISVDGKPANRLPRTERGAYLVLSSPDYEPQVTTIPVAGDLDRGSHVAEVVADGGWGQRPLVGWQVGRGPETLGYDHALRGLAGGAVAFLIGLIGWRAQWSRDTRRRTGYGVEPAWPLATPHRPALSSRLGSPAFTILAAAVFYASPWLPLTLVSGAALAAAIILRLDLGLALVAFSAPFYLHPRPLLGKSFSMAEIATLLCAISWGLRQIRRHTPQTLVRVLDNLSLVDLAVLFLALSASVSTFFADHRHVALRELRVAILEPALFYTMLRTSKLDKEGIWRIVHAFVGGATAVALIGLAQYALNINIITAEEGFRRLRSVYGSPNNAALYLGRALPVLIAVALLAVKERRRVLYGVLAVPVGLAILFSFSRAGIVLGVPISLLVLGVLARGRWRWIALGLIAVVGVAVIPLLATPRFAGLLDPNSGTFFFRLQLWRSSWKMFRDHPFLGVGPDNFLYQYRGRYILPAAWQEPHLSHAHNVLLSYATRLGLLGLAAGILLQVSFWRHARRLSNVADPERRALALGLMGSMAYSLAHGLLDASYFFVDLAFAFLLTLGLVQSLVRSDIHGQES